MRSKRYRVAIAAASVIAIVTVGQLLVPRIASAGSGTGTARVTINAPDGVPANVLLRGRARLVAAKPPAGTATTVNLSAAAGEYRVKLPAINFGGVRYVGRSSRREVGIRAGRSTSLAVTYAAEPGARDLHTVSISQTGLTLTWTAPAGSKFSLRRSTGQTAPRSRSRGVKVPTTGTSATDQGLTPGTQYSYSLFTKIHRRWYGPLTITVMTAPAAGSTDASYVAGPSTFIATPADIASVTTTGTGVQVVLSGQIQAPLVGSAMILPVTTAVPGGYLGVVSAVSADGRTVDLAPGGLSDAFDYYELSVDSFTTDESILPAVASSPSTPAPQTSKSASKKQASPAKVDRPAPKAATPKAATPKAAAPKAAAPNSPAAKAAAPAAFEQICGQVSGSQKVTYSPSMALGGHFKTKLDKYHFLGVDVPTGASLDMALTAKVVGAAAIETTGEYGCKLPLPKLFKTLTLNPVPMAVSLEPTAQFTIGAAVTVSNLGATATGGVQVAGSMTLKNGPSFSGSTILNSSPLTPTVKANGSIGLKLGGELILGPGIGTANAGVIAGVKGELNPLDASFKPFFPVGDANFNACVQAKAAFSAGLSLTAKAWLNNWTLSQDITLDALNTEVFYPGSPWDLPSGCSADQGTPDSLLGPGVSKVTESTSGSSQQWGHVDGFAPGTKTWVLSTGLISDAVGTPDQFASTPLDLPGDADLTALAGFPTHDAASYQVTVVPAASTLHVRYVFASEEYPEYVGSQFNDVMAVYVDGKNCATVPGTDTPVSVNTINAGENSSFHVDNSTGAAGYSTTMDGLTVPLTCSVPVTAGQPVVVRIAVADTSDAIYDSAVALVDGGIWTD
jgi:hypothetical protein